MSDQRVNLTLWSTQQAAPELTRTWAWIKAMLAAGHSLTLTAKKRTRSIKQNAVMWSCLTDLSKQVPWFGKRMTPEGWKCWITGHLNGQELVPNMTGDGFISITKGQSTSDMTIAEMTAVIDLCHAFGDEKGVNWSKTSLGREFEIDAGTDEIVVQA